MLNFTDIVAQYPPPLQGFRQYILREYLQYKILSIISNSTESRKLAFLGGTALCIVHHNSRFSEDIDFDNFGLTEADFEHLTKTIERELKLDGFQVEMRNIHKGVYRCYIRFPELLFQLGLAPNEEQKILIQLDTASHNFSYVPETYVLNKFDIFSPIRVTPSDILLSQKFYAAISRKTPKGRDFYDVVFLLAKTKPNYDYLKAKLGVGNSEELRNLILTKIQRYNFEELTEDVQNFLFNSRDSQRVTMFPEYIKTVNLE